jgi:hypothetical protein
MKGDSAASVKMEPLNAGEHQTILEELKRREPLFHRPEFGRTRAEFEDMTDADFFEVGASGRQYSREFVLDSVAKRYEDPRYVGMDSPPESSWEMKEFQCFEIAVNSYLLTYTLVQGPRVTRRATIWRRIGASWKILYHQGTVVENT